MILQKKMLLFFTLLFSFSGTSLIAGESLWSRSAWPDPDNLSLTTVAALVTVALTIGHTSAIGFDHYWKKNKKVFGVFSAATVTGIGILAYASLVNSNLETRHAIFSTFGLGVVTALISSSVGMIWNNLYKEKPKKSI